ncbi:Uncharacterised protein [Pantoea agglomerans]|nr:Uncharacterised protein [Pantoea agglomerans]
MKKEPSQTNITLSIPLNLVIAMLSCVIVLLVSYICINYVHAAPVQHLTTSFQAAQSKENQSLPVIKP